MVLNLTVTSSGTQFDRLASLSLDHVESSSFSLFFSCSFSTDLFPLSLEDEHG